MLPRWLALVLLGVVLILAGVFLAPLLPGTVGTFAYYVLLIGGVVAAVYGLAVLLLGHTRRTP